MSILSETIIVRLFTNAKAYSTIIEFACLLWNFLRITLCLFYSESNFSHFLKLTAFKKSSDPHHRTSMPNILYFIYASFPLRQLFVSPNRSHFVCYYDHRSSFLAAKK